MLPKCGDAVIQSPNAFVALRKVAISTIILLIKSVSIYRVNPRAINSICTRDFQGADIVLLYPKCMQNLIMGHHIHAQVQCN